VNPETDERNATEVPPEEIVPSNDSQLTGGQSSGIDGVPQADNLDTKLNVESLGGSPGAETDKDSNKISGLAQSPGTEKPSFENQAKGPNSNEPNKPGLPIDNIEVVPPTTSPTLAVDSEQVPKMDDKFGQNKAGEQVENKYNDGQQINNDKENKIPNSPEGNPPMIKTMNGSEQNYTDNDNKDGISPDKRQIDGNSQGAPSVQDKTIGSVEKHKYPGTKTSGGGSVITESKKLGKDDKSVPEIGEVDMSKIKPGPVESVEPTLIKTKKPYIKTVK
jgi:hypothetical protein